MYSPLVLSSIAPQEGGQPHQLVLPAPPVPSASSSPSKVPLALPSPSTTIWPFSDPRLVFYLDSTPKAESIKRNLERRALAAGLTFRTTDDPNQASHVILDSSSDQNLALRSLPRALSLDWLKDSFFEEKGLPEEDYKLRVPVLSSAEPSNRKTVEGGGEDVAERREFVSRNPPRRGEAWRHGEEEDMALFLASDPLKQGKQVGSIWGLYQKSHPSRTAVAYRGHYQVRRREYFAFKVAELKAANNGQPIVYEHPEVEELSQEEEDRPRFAAYMANRKTAGTENKALAAPRRKVLGDEAELRSTSSNFSSLGDSSDESSTLDASETIDPRPTRPPAPSSSSRSTSARKPSRAGKGCRSPWTKQEDDDLVHLLWNWKEARRLLWEAFSRKHPRRTPESARKRYESQRETMDLQVVALQRKDGKQTRPAAASESEELEDDEEMDLRMPTSASSSSSFLVDRKRPQGPQQGSSKRIKVDAPINAVASSSKPSFSTYQHQNQPHHHPSSQSYASGSNYPVNQPRAPLPSFTRRVAVGPTSLRHPQPPSIPSHYAPPPPPLTPPPAAVIDSSSGEEEDLEPPSFLELGSRPSGCSPSSPWCFFCGCDKDGSDTFKEIALAAKNPKTGQVQKVRARLACDVCETTWERRFVRKLKLDEGVAGMGELERLAWVTEVLIEKGLKVRERRVKGWNWDGGRSR